MAGSKENPPMAIMGDYRIKVLGYLLVELDS